LSSSKWLKASERKRRFRAIAQRAALAALPKHLKASAVQAGDNSPSPRALLVRDPSWPWADLAALDHQDQSSPAPHHLISGRKKKKKATRREHGKKEQIST